MQKLLQFLQGVRVNTDEQVVPSLFRYYEQVGVERRRCSSQVVYGVRCCSRLRSSLFTTRFSVCSALRNIRQELVREDHVHKLLLVATGLVRVPPQCLNFVCACDLSQRGVRRNLQHTVVASRVPCIPVLRCSRRGLCCCAGRRRASRVGGAFCTEWCCAACGAAAAAAAGTGTGAGAGAAAGTAAGAAANCSTRASRAARQRRKEPLDASTSRCWRWVSGEFPATASSRATAAVHGGTASLQHRWHRRRG
mmetsp:Transcript_61753/g.155924  ORF Transcript_61753/g.155924 Transcript_61753/m.155924 type:complete len:251 (+) Transcript_61753:1365-2117(+)